MPREIVELRRDDDTYHVVLGDDQTPQAARRTAAVNITPEMRNMSEKDRLAEVARRANEIIPEERDR